MPDKLPVDGVLRFPWRVLAGSDLVELWRLDGLAIVFSMVFGLFIEFLMKIKKLGDILISMDILNFFRMTKNQDFVLALSRKGSNGRYRARTGINSRHFGQFSPLLPHMEFAEGKLQADRKRSAQQATGNRQQATGNRQQATGNIIHIFQLIVSTYY